MVNARTAPKLNFDEVDWWAVRIVIREGVKMGLSYSEKVAAVKVLRERNTPFKKIADILHISIGEVEAMSRRLSREDDEPTPAHSYTPASNGLCILCGMPAEHPNHRESWI